MGDNKMLLEVGGAPLLRRAATRAAKVGFDPVLVVTGHERGRAEASVAGIDCRTVFNPEHEEGIHTSVRAGIDALDEGVDAVVIMLADMPFVSTDMLRRLVARYRTSDASLVISKYGDIPAPPMLYDRSLFHELRVMTERCGRQVIRRHRDQAVEIHWPEKALADVDTPTQYQDVRERIEAGDDSDRDRPADSD
jgi:molybdenum cofactor cytidylyltransferase